MNPKFECMPLWLLTPMSTFPVPSRVVTVLKCAWTLVSRLLFPQTGTTIIRTGVSPGGSIRLPPLERVTTSVFTRWAEMFYEAVYMHLSPFLPPMHRMLNVPVKPRLRKRDALSRSVPLLRTSVLTASALLVLVKCLPGDPRFIIIGSDTYLLVNCRQIRTTPLVLLIVLLCAVRVARFLRYRNLVACRNRCACTL